MNLEDSTNNGEYYLRYINENFTAESDSNCSTDIQNIINIPNNNIEKHIRNSVDDNQETEYKVPSNIETKQNQNKLYRSTPFDKYREVSVQKKMSRNITQNSSKQSAASVQITQDIAANICHYIASHISYVPRVADMRTHPMGMPMFGLSIPSVNSLNSNTGSHSTIDTAMPPLESISSHDNYQTDPNGFQIFDSSPIPCSTNPFENVRESGRIMNYDEIGPTFIQQLRAVNFNQTPEEAQLITELIDTIVRQAQEAPNDEKLVHIDGNVLQTLLYQVEVIANEQAQRMANHQVQWMLHALQQEQKQQQRKYQRRQIESMVNLNNIDSTYPRVQSPFCSTNPYITNQFEQTNLQSPAAMTPVTSSHESLKTVKSAPQIATENQNHPNSMSIKRYTPQSPPILSATGAPALSQSPTEFLSDQKAIKPQRQRQRKQRQQKQQRQQQKQQQQQFQYQEEEEEEQQQYVHYQYDAYQQQQLNLVNLQQQAEHFKNQMQQQQRMQREQLQKQLTKEYERQQMYHIESTSTVDDIIETNEIPTMRATKMNNSELHEQRIGDFDKKANSTANPYDDINEKLLENSNEKAQNEQPPAEPHPSQPFIITLFGGEAGGAGDGNNYEEENNIEEDNEGDFDDCTDTDEDDVGHKDEKHKYVLPQKSLIDLNYTFDDTKNWEEMEQPPKDCLYELLNFMINNHSQSNVQIMVGEVSFNCHMMVLQCYSGFFMDCNNEVVVQLPVDKITPSAFVMVYDWMLVDNPQVQRDGILELFAAANFLRIKELVDQCWLCLDDDKRFSEDTAFMLYMEARLFNMRNLEMLMLSRVCKFFLTLVSSQEFLDLNVNEILTLLNSNTIGVNSEIEIFMAAVRWLSYDWWSREDYMVPVIMCVRFALLPPCFLIILTKEAQSLDIVRVVSHPDVRKLINEGLSFNTAMLFYGQNRHEYVEFLQRYSLDSPPQRQWIYDTECPYHINPHKDIPNFTRSIISFRMFNDYLRQLSGYGREYWKYIHLVSEEIGKKSTDQKKLAQKSKKDAPIQFDKFSNL